MKKFVEKKGTEVKICANCKHFEDYKDRKVPIMYPLCTRSTYQYQDPITGEVSTRGHQYAEAAREQNEWALLRYLSYALTLNRTYLKKNCGPEAIYYETAQSV